MRSNTVSRKRFLRGLGTGSAAAFAWELGFLPKPGEALDWYDAIIVGTGFGAAVAAQTLIAAKKKVLMLERGVWYLSPDRISVKTKTRPQIDYLREKKLPFRFWPRPDHQSGLAAIAQAVRQIGSIVVNRTGLYQYNSFKDASIVTASGVGGGSLIYSNVNIVPDKSIRDRLKLTDQNYQDATNWMVTNRGKLNKIVTKSPVPQETDFRALAADVDVDSPDPTKAHVGKNYLLLDRSRVLFEAADKVAKDLGVANGWAPLDLSVNEADPRADLGKVVEPQADGQKAYCERQGRCALGCLPQARHTLNKLYYKIWNSPDAALLTIWPKAEVSTIARSQNGWTVAFTDYADEKAPKATSRSAPQLFMAAGSLGTTEILLRSKQQGKAPLPSMIGKKFSTNGDFGAFVRKTRDPVYSTRGPINTCHVRFVQNGRNITVEDCAIPSMFARVTAQTIRLSTGTLVDKLAFLGQWAFAWATRSPNVFAKIQQGQIDSDTEDAKNEAEFVSNTFFFNVMGEDDANGTFTLKNGKLDLAWPSDARPQNHPIFSDIEALLKRFADAMGGTYVPLPTWNGWLLHKLIVTHPIGGCPIGDDSSSGTVNEHGQMFDGSPGAGPKDVLPGLYVVDGAVLPMAVAANPTLTIVAQALKTMSAARA